jgi:hypothetical protein
MITTYCCFALRLNKQECGKGSTNVEFRGL